MKISILTSILFLSGISPAMAKTSPLDGTWRIVGRVCAKAGGFEKISSPNTLSFSGNTYVYTFGSAGCSLRKEGTVQIKNRSVVQCVASASLDAADPSLCPSNFKAHVDLVNGLLASGPQCETQSYDIAELYGRKTLLLRENGGTDLFCEAGDFQLDFFESR